MAGRQCLLHTCGHRSISSYQVHSPEKGAKALSATRNVNTSGQVAARPPRNGTKSHNQRAYSSNTARTRQANTDANAGTPQQRRNTESMSLESEATLTSPSLKSGQARGCFVAGPAVNSSALNEHANTSSSASMSITTTCKQGGGSKQTRWNLAAGPMLTPCQIFCSHTSKK